MKNLARIVACGLLFLSPTISPVLAANAAPDARVSKERMVRGLETIQSIFEALYAPTEWKRSYAKWDLDDQIAAARAKVEASGDVSVKEYQRILRSFFLSPQDYHVSVKFQSTESSSLPFHVLSAGGSYYLAYIDRDKLSKRSFPFEIGDELVSFDGKPAATAVAELQAQFGKTTTDAMLAEVALTKRKGITALPCPHGPVMVGIKSQATGKVSNFQLVWDYTPEKINYNQLASLSKPSSTGFGQDGDIRTSSLLNRQMLSGAINYFDPAVANPNPFTLAARQSYIPALGEKTWQSDAKDAFYAYIFKTAEGKQIGYVRIPWYMEKEDHSAAFAKLMAKFSEQTDALVIDQVNNPGGSVFYLYSLVSMLTDQAMYTPKHRMSISQAEVMEAIEMGSQLEKVRNDDDAVALLGETVNGYPVTYQFARFVLDYLQFYVEQWNSGKTLTDPYHIYGVDRINPHPEVNYTKPILLLVNSLDFSGGDFFPAILQDNKRAVIFGTRTAGAGGYVLKLEYPNLFGIQSFNVTGSLAERINKKPIENLGVKPDIEYQLTRDDMQHNFRSYVGAINATLKTMTP